jgi:phosphoenolpyruvate-protein kinase (PTS system EI component)
LDELDSFKETTVKELKQQNQQCMQEVSSELKERNDQLVKKSLEDKSMLLNETKSLLKEDQLLFQEYTQVVREAEMATVFLK